ncbi:4-coumarate--CoA ligase 1 [Ixodes scapularis]
MSFYQVVKQCLEKHGNRTAVVWENEEISCADLLKMCQRYAAGFQGHGIKKGDTVLVHLDNSLENLITMYSVIFAGGVAVLSFPGFSNDDLLYQIRNSDATYIVTTASEANRLNDFRHELNMKGYFTVGTAEGFISVTEFKTLNEDMYEEFPVKDVKNEVVLVIYTSGTTGRPKAVEHTHYSIVARLPPSLFTDDDIIASRMSITTLLGFRIYLSASCIGTKTVMFPTPAGIEEILEGIGKYKIVDIKSGKVLGPNEQGEALVKKPTAMRGYYGNPEATLQTITPDGWVRTGDICYYNEDGQFFFVERMNQLFRCKGSLVAPSSIESVLLSHEGIADAAVIGVPHSKYLEVAMAFVVLKTSHSELTEAEIQNFVAGELESNMHLHAGVKFVQTIPRNEDGKVIRRKLRELPQDD